MSKEKFIILTRSFLYSKEWQDLTPFDRDIYQILKDKCAYFPYDFNDHGEIVHLLEKEICISTEEIKEVAPRTGGKGNPWPNLKHIENSIKRLIKAGFLSSRTKRMGQKRMILKVLRTDTYNIEKNENGVNYGENGVKNGVNSEHENGVNFPHEKIAENGVNSEHENGVENGVHSKERQKRKDLSLDKETIKQCKQENVEGMPPEPFVSRFRFLNTDLKEGTIKPQSDIVCSVNQNFDNNPPMPLAEDNAKKGGNMFSFLDSIGLTIKDINILKKTHKEHPEKLKKAVEYALKQREVNKSEGKETCLIKYINWVMSNFHCIENKTQEVIDINKKFANDILKIFRSCQETGSIDLKPTKDNREILLVTPNNDIKIPWDSNIHAFREMMINEIRKHGSDEFYKTVEIMEMRKNATH